MMKAPDLFSKEAEIILLGAMLDKADHINVAVNLISTEDFYFIEHKIIFDAIFSRYRRDEPTDLNLLHIELKGQNKLEAAGGIKYLMEIAQSSGSGVYIENYLRIIIDYSTLRKIVFATEEIKKKAFEMPEDVSGFMDVVQKTFYEIGAKTSQTGMSLGEIALLKDPLSNRNYFEEALFRKQRYLEAGENQVAISGIPTGLIDVDKLINGLGDSNLIILAARPGMGKTAFALNIAEEVYSQSKGNVAIFTLEMNADQILHRFACFKAEITSDSIKNGKFNDAEEMRLAAAMQEIEDYKMRIEFKAGISLTELRSKARRLKEAYDIKLIIIDYLQLIASEKSGNTENRQVEVANISKGLKNLARELNIPILCLAQLSRKVEERTCKRPMLSDLRESGAIEQDADQILFLLRPEYYDPLDKPGLAECIVAKNRHGATGVVKLVFRGDIGRFLNYIPLETIKNFDNKDDFDKILGYQ